MKTIDKIKSISTENLQEIILSAKSKRDVLRLLGFVKINNKQATDYLTKFIEDNNIDIRHFKIGRPLEWRYSREEVEEKAKKNISWTGLMADLGIRFVGSNILTVKKLIKFYNVDVSHFNLSQALSNASRNSRSDEERFCKNSTICRSSLKRHIIKNNLIEYNCKKCGLGDQWQNETLVLTIEHINGVNDDNRLENLCFLCPNCHSQTGSFAGRNQKGKTRVDNTTK